MDTSNTEEKIQNSCEEILKRSSNQRHSNEATIRSQSKPMSSAKMDQRK